MNPEYVYNVNESGGGGDMLDRVVGRLGKRWVRSMGITKKFSNLVGGKNTYMGRQLRNLSAMFGKRSSFVNQIVKNKSVIIFMDGDRGGYSLKQILKKIIICKNVRCVEEKDYGEVQLLTKLQVDGLLSRSKILVS